MLFYPVRYVLFAFQTARNKTGKFNGHTIRVPFFSKNLLAILVTQKIFGGLLSKFA
jgi:hypothetical protein